MRLDLNAVGREAELRGQPRHDAEAAPPFAKVPARYRFRYPQGPQTKVYLAEVARDEARNRVDLAEAVDAAAWDSSRKV